MIGCLLVALFPDPEHEGFLGRHLEAVVQRRASGRDGAAAGRATRQGGTRVQTGQRLHGRLTGAEREATGQLLDLKKPLTHSFLFNVYIWKLSNKGQKMSNHKESLLWTK